MPFLYGSGNFAPYGSIDWDCLADFPGPLGLKVRPGKRTAGSRGHKAYGQACIPTTGTPAHQRQGEQYVTER